jgi:cytochrome d ubiquinol oxidase subunit II
VPLWAGILALAVFMYVLLDGFDLGVGMLFALRRDEHDRDLMMASLAPVWDFNETWLVLGGTALLAVFPLAFAIIVPALYFPILAMLLGLLFRGVAFEFREVEGAHRPLWDRGFVLGSLVATFAQGVILGNFITGFAVHERAFAGTSWDWFAPVPLLTLALAVVLKRSLDAGRELLPFLCSFGLFFLAFTGLVISLWPYVAPPSISLWDAAVGPKAQAFLMVGTLFLLPVILLYVVWSYWVFRGKVTGAHGYHA